MKIISDDEGFSIIFESKEGFKQHLNNLKGFKEAVEKRGMKPPYVYSIFNDNLDKDYMQEKVNEIKQKFEG